MSTTSYLQPEVVAVRSHQRVPGGHELLLTAYRITERERAFYDCCGQAWRRQRSWCCLCELLFVFLFEVEIFLLRVDIFFVRVFSYPARDFRLLQNGECPKGAENLLCR